MFGTYISSHDGHTIDNTVWGGIFGGIALFRESLKKAPELILLVLIFVTAARLAMPTEIP